MLEKLRSILKERTEGGVGSKSMTLARLSELTGISQPKLSQFRKYQGVMLTYAEAESLAATLLPGFMLGLVPKPMAPIHLVENETEDASHD